MEDALESKYGASIEGSNLVMNKFTMGRGGETMYQRNKGNKFHQERAKHADAVLKPRFQQMR